MKFLISLALVVAAAAAAFGQHIVPAKVTFDSGTSSELPFRIEQNLIILQASVNGLAGAFIFDTGAESTVVDTAFAAKAGLKQTGKTTGTGSAGTAPAGVIKGVTVELGGLKTIGSRVYSLALDSFAPSFGFVVDGIIGNDIIGAAVVEIDYRNQKLRLIVPSSFRPPASAEIIPLTIKGNLPFVHTEMTPLVGKPIPVRMEIDTGSTGAVLLNSPFVRTNRMAATLHSSRENRTGGVGGSGTSIVGRVASLRFGKTLLKGPITVLYTGTKGDDASKSYDGLIGGAIFRRFMLTVDLPGKRLFVEPGPNVSDPFDMDMSGLEIVADGPDLKTYLIDEVRPGSAGATSGIEEGDTIEAIDGKPVVEMGLNELHRLLRQDGASYDLVIRAKGKIMHIRLNLKREI